MRSVSRGRSVIGPCVTSVCSWVSVWRRGRVSVVSVVMVSVWRRGDDEAVDLERRRSEEEARERETKVTSHCFPACLLWDPREKERERMRESEQERAKERATWTMPEFHVLLHQAQVACEAAVRARGRGCDMMRLARSPHTVHTHCPHTHGPHTSRTPSKHAYSNNPQNPQNHPNKP